MKILFTNFHCGRSRDTYIATIARALVKRHRIFVAAPGSNRLFDHASALRDVASLAMEFSTKLKVLARMRAAGRALLDPGSNERGSTSFT
ncbi:hypothetical protein [Caballeronia telluris]|uniref:Glycosyl transferase family 1 n=1 Tax=Caballeronia telluris TaxID=326475 RepID=A0A158FD74_9BURK|nr:hypothetical protein [Caballeronia telluris]SAL17563.1 glycosyl transferase family 1 [Caballeronia telluris]